MRFLEIYTHYKCPHCGYFSSTADRLPLNEWTCPACSRRIEESGPPIADFRLIPKDQIDSHLVRLYSVLLAAAEKRRGQSESPPG